MSKNLGLKLFSILIALGLSLYVNSENQNSSIGISVPVEVKNIPVDKIIIWPIAPKVQVTLEGPSYEVSRVATGRYVFSTELPKQVGSTYIAQLDKSALGLPASIKIVALEPNQIEFTLDTKIEREMVVEVPKIGALKPDLVLSKLEVIPAKIKLSGPKSELDKIKQIETEPINLATLEGSNQIVLALRLSGSQIRAERNDVTARYVVGAEIIERVFKDLPLELRMQQARVVQIEPNHVEVKLRGSKSALDSLDPAKIRAYVRLDSSEELGEQLVQIEALERIEVLQVMPKSVTIKSINKELPGIQKGGQKTVNK